MNSEADEDSDWDSLEEEEKEDWKEELKSLNKVEQL